MSKFVVALLGVMVSLSAFADAPEAVRQATASEKYKVLEQVTTYVMIRGALAEAKKNGEKCESSIVSAVLDDGGAITYEAQINCSIPDGPEFGGGVVLMINVQGRAFSTFLDNIVIKVDKAG